MSNDTGCLICNTPIFADTEDWDYPLCHHHFCEHKSSRKTDLMLAGSKLRSEIALHKEYERRVIIKVNRVINSQNYETEKEFFESIESLRVFVMCDFEEMLKLEEEVKIEI